MGKNKNKESIKDGFYYRFRFTEQIKELDTISQAGELLDAAESYVKGEEFIITDKVVKMAFVSWKTQFDWDLKKSEEYHKERKKISEHANEVKAENRRKREAEQKPQQPELFKEEAKGDDVPIVEAEEVEPYPFEYFWREYISHKDEKNARNIWAHLYDDSRKKAIDGAKIYTQYVLARKAKDPNFDAILKPSTYLKDAHWNDEYKEEELTPQNYGNNNRSYQSDYELRKQQQNAVLTDFMAEAAARVQAIEDAKNRVENI